MYCGQMKPDRNNLPMLSGRNRRLDSFFFLSDFFVFVVAIVARFLAEVNGGKIPA